MKNRITPNNITRLKLKEIFVFGSNLSGKHGKGAARTALEWGARWGKGVGLYGSTYGIPTKGHSVRHTLPIIEIKPFVDDFIVAAKDNPDYTFLVTEIGCGLAGYDANDIAPLFKDAMNVNNIHLPERFWNVLNVKM